MKFHVRENRANPTTTQTNPQTFERHLIAFHEIVLSLPVMIHMHINT